MTTSKAVNERREAKRSQYLLAQEGDRETLQYFLETWNLKVYTNEEVRVLNRLLERKKKKMEGEIITVRSQNKVIGLPTLWGDVRPAQLNWIEDMGEGYFRAGLTYLGGYPYGDGSTEWVLQLDPEEGFKPLFCALYWD